MIVSDLSCACFSVCDLLQSFASIYFVFHLVLHMSSVSFIFDFPVCCELSCLGVGVAKVLAKNPLFSSFSEFSSLLENGE